MLASHVGFCKNEVPVNALLVKGATDSWWSLRPDTAECDWRESQSCVSIVRSSRKFACAEPYETAGSQDEPCVGMTGNRRAKNVSRLACDNRHRHR